MAVGQKESHISRPRPATNNATNHGQSQQQQQQSSDEQSDAVYYPSEEFRSTAHCKSLDQYFRMYKRSIEDPDGFWSEIAQDFHWKAVPNGSNILKYNFDQLKGSIYCKWMEGAVTNICYNAVDRIIERGQGDRLAYIWEGNEIEESKRITYNELKTEICKMANVYKSKGIKKGDRIAIYMPQTIELVIAMLAAARIGAIHSVVFAGFSADALAERIIDANCVLLVTADGVFRGTKYIPLKDIADDALQKCSRRSHQVRGCIVHRHLKCPVIVNGATFASINLNGSSTNSAPSNNSINNNNSNSITNNNNATTNGQNGVLTLNGINGVSGRYIKPITWNEGVDIWWDEALGAADPNCDPVWVDAEDPLFILYTSGSTGKPKGVLHTTGGYMIYSATTFKYVFNYHEGDVFFCTADLGWITGHTVNVYGSLCNGATILLFEGTPFYPDAGRLWQIVDRHHVNIFYTAPTAIRALMKYGESYVRRYNRGSLKLLGTAGEPINPEAWNWYYRVVGNQRCPIVDTFWQTETGAPMLTPLPGCTPMKPGSATLPFFGVQPAVVDDDGRELQGPCEGNLVIKAPWPSMMRTVDGNHKRFELTYFDKFPNYYFTGDGCRRDKDGYYWIIGRCDDMLNVSGHLLSTAEVETALVEHKAIAETAAVATNHPVKGECLYCFVVLKDGLQFDKELEMELKQRVRSRIGAFAAPEVIHPCSALPKTRSGKIMRRVLRKIARDDRDLGDLTSLADEQIIDELFSTKHLYAVF